MDKSESILLLLAIVVLLLATIIGVLLIQARKRRRKIAKRRLTIESLRRDSDFYEQMTEQQSTVKLENAL